MVGLGLRVVDSVFGKGGGGGVESRIGGEGERSKEDTEGWS